MNWDTLPEPVQIRKQFLEHVGFDLEPDLADIHRLYREGWKPTELAEAAHVDVRTIYRYIRGRSRCPGERCLTWVVGGGLCRFCRA